MTQSIIVPLDGSPSSEHALPLAFAIARATGGGVQLVHVHQPQPVLVTALGGTETDWNRGAWHRQQLYLREIVDRCQESTGITVRPDLLSGTPAQTLAEYAQGVEGGLVVMTTHGRSGLSRAWLGSVAGELVRQSRVPVLLLRPREDEPDMAPATLPRRILIPLDGSALAEQVLEPALALGALAGAEYTLLRVVSADAWLGSPPYSATAPKGESPQLERLREDAESEIRRVADRLAASSLAVRTAVVVHTQPAAAVLDYAAEQNIDLIAMATNARSGLARMAMGSVADKVLRGAEVPVLLYRPVEDRAAATHD